VLPQEAGHGPGDTDDDDYDAEDVDPISDDANPLPADRFEVEKTCDRFVHGHAPVEAVSPARLAVTQAQSRTLMVRILATSAWHDLRLLYSQIEVGASLI
jgi:hypothetical protein